MADAKLRRPERVFLSLKEFYAKDRRRVGSPEFDFGVHWGSKWPFYRVPRRSRMRGNVADSKSRVELYGDLMRMDVLSVTEARVAYGSASLKEYLGWRFPRLFKKWAADNARRDEQAREMRQMMERWRQRIAEWREESAADTRVVPRD